MDWRGKAGGDLLRIGAAALTKAVIANPEADVGLLVGAAVLSTVGAVMG
jgi:uncharacterized YccA/Bax inhibitor family protein